jgi:Mg2+ and Co2+ transporter CorA
MSILEIKNNFDNLDEKTQDELKRYIHELLIREKQQYNKIASLKTEINYLHRHLKKLRDMIDRSLKTNVKDEVWKNE